MLYLELPVIVEGKYDKIKLSGVIGSPIITTGGFGLFRDKQKTELIRKLAQAGGVIVITDSDGAGQVIRGRIKSIASGCRVENIYIPQIKGKEKRKQKPSKAGFLGVEGLDEKLLESLLQKYVSAGKTCRKPLTKADLYELGLCGGKDAAALRDRVCKMLDLPCGLNANALLEAANLLYSGEIFIKEAKKVLTSD